MSNYITLARPYATAAFLQAKAEDQLAEWSTMLDLLASIIAIDELQQSILDPRLPTSTVAAWICDACAQQLSATGQNFVHILAQANRLMLMPEIKTLYTQQYATEHNRVDIKLRSAYPLTTEQQEKLSALISKHLNKKMTMQLAIDEHLLGGIVIQAGDTVIDLSVQGRLQQLQRGLSR